jgi:hypothetical protein
MRPDDSLEPRGQRRHASDGHTADLQVKGVHPMKYVKIVAADTAGRTGLTHRSPKASSP